MAGFENQGGLTPGEPEHCGTTSLLLEDQQVVLIGLRPSTKAVARKAPGLKGRSSID